MTRMSTVFLSLIAFIAGGACITGNTTPLPLVVPTGWPKPVYDLKKNKTTQEGFILGNNLFYDPILSRDSTISCASCHLSFTAFTHADHSLSHGIEGRFGKRNSIALENLAWSPSFMWDGGLNNLEQQAINPITNRLEMDNTMANAVNAVNRSSKYRRLFYLAFNDSTVNAKTLLKALAQFTVMLESYNSKYDSVMRKEEGVAFTASEQNGYTLFKQHCNSCHTEPLFTNYSFQNNGLAPDTALNDLGRMLITHDEKDRYKFKVPSLRNIEFSAPYFHDGRVNKLKEAIEHYTSGIAETPSLAKELRHKIVLSAAEKKDLAAFLKTLSDRAFLYNAAFRNISSK